MRSSAGDLALFVADLMADSSRLLTKASVTLMWPADYAHALAWWGRDAQYGDRSAEAFQHGGFMRGVRTHVMVFPQHRKAAIVLLNSEQRYGHVLRHLMTTTLGISDAAFFNLAHV